MNIITNLMILKQKILTYVTNGIKDNIIKLKFFILKLN